jgi:hypothetical protein
MNDMNATITATGNANNIVTDYSAQDAADDARMILKVWVVVNDETGEDMTGLMTHAEASKYIIDMSMDVRPSAYKGWMHIAERDVEVFTDEQEELFTELSEACENLRGAEMTKAFRSNGTPDFRIDQMEKSIKAAKVWYNEAMDKLIAKGNDAGRAFGRWRKLNK